MSTNKGANDKRIDALHSKAAKLWPELERIIDELKACGPHSLNGDNAISNVRQWLRDLSRR